MIEILIFRLADGADPADLLALESRIQTEVVYHQSGFVRRTVGRSDDGRWLILQIWATSEAAEAGRVALEQSSLGSAWSDLVTSVSLDRFAGVG